MKKRTDFERVLMNIAIDTTGTVHDTMRRIKNGWTMRFIFDHPAPQFIPIEMAKDINMPLKKGDIVRCKTNPNHHWGISVFVEQLEYSRFLLQKIGGEALCNMNNESLDILRFMNPARLYTGHQYQVYLWASKKAFQERYNKDADYFKRCGGVEFDGDKLIIWCRPHICTLEKRQADKSVLYAQPKKFILNWDKNTRLKDIITAMKEQGFATDFIYAPEKPTEGQGGYTSLTRSDIEL